MNLEELKAQNPVLFAEAVALGMKEEHRRVAALLAMKREARYEKYPAVHAVLDECITTPGATVADANARIMEVLSSPSAHAEAESPGPIGTGIVDSPTGEGPSGGAGAAWKSSDKVEA